MIIELIEFASKISYLRFMQRYPHPERDEIELARVMEALSDPTRLAIVAFLASLADGAVEAQCGAFTCFGSKSNLTYHLARLREAGVTRTRVAGTARLISLRADDLGARFPGLLDSVVAAALSEPARAETVRQARAELQSISEAAA
jgi:DNA-binding transcriptional ArsR family regulator